MVWADDDLFVGVDGQAMYPHVCIYDGVQVRILHASASLGTAAYSPAAAGWSRTEDFAWTARESDDAALATSQRAEYLDTAGWTGTTVSMGRPGQTEFRIHVSDPAWRIAVTTFGSDGPRTWPAGVADDCANQQLLLGNAPEHAHFDPSNWAPTRPPTE